VNEPLGHAELAYQEIRQAIVEGRYAPGQRLVEQRIATELNLSRTPVREALRRLEADALVKIELHRGAVVRSVSGEEIRDLYELRAHLESLAAQRAAARATPEQLAALQQAVAQFDEAVHNASPHRVESLRAVSRTNQAVHGLIVESGHHQRLADLLQRTVDIPLVFAAFAQFDANGLERSSLFHHLIVSAITAREGQRAADLMREHIFQGRDRLLASISDDVNSALQPREL